MPSCYFLCGQALFARQAQVREELEAAYRKEYAEYLQRWEQASAEMKAKIEAQTVALQQKHEAAMAAFQAARSEPALIKFSPTVLDLRKREEALANMMEFTRAHRLKQQADEAEEYEKQAHLKAWRRKVAGEQAQLISTHEREDMAFRMKVSVAAQLLAATASQPAHLATPASPVLVTLV